MKRFIASLALSSLSLLTTNVNAAIHHIGTFSCPATEGSYLPALTAKVYFFSVEVDQTDNLLAATIYLDDSILPLLLFSESGTYSQCTIVSGSQMFYLFNAINQGVGETSIGAGLEGAASAESYTTAFLTFQALSVGGTSISIKHALSDEVLAKAKANFKARSFGIPHSSGVE